MRSETLRSYPKGGLSDHKNLFVRMLGNVTSTQAMMLRFAQFQDEGAMRDEHASLAKAFFTAECHETVGYAGAAANAALALRFV